MSVTIRAAVVADAPVFAAALRPEDRRECEASGYPAELILQAGIGMSSQVFVALDDGEPLAIWGYSQASPIAETAEVWLLTCAGVARHRKAFVRVSRAQIAIWRDAGVTIGGSVDGRYGKAMHWLAREGFEIDACPALAGPDRLPFHNFRKVF